LEDPVAFPTITERPGSLSATGFAKEAANAFGVPVAANTFLPMNSNTLAEDPGWFSPTLMQGVRDKQIYNLQGEAKFNGAVTGPLFPSNAMTLLVASIGQDAAPGYGVTGSTPTSSTTLAGSITANTNTFSLTSATGYAIGSIIQVDVNVPATPTTTEVRKIATLTGTTGTVDSNWLYGHASGVAVSVVVAPFTHTINQANSLASLTVEKNIGGYQSLQFAGCRINKFDLKAPVANTAPEITVDLMGQSVAVLTSPTAVSVANEIPFVFTEASLTMFGGTRNDVTNTSISIENGVKETYTYSGQHGPSFLTPVSLHCTGAIDMVWSSLNDATYGDFNRMANQTTGAYSFTLAHPGSGGSITISLPQVVLSKYTPDIKYDDVVRSSLTYEASRPLTGSSQYTVSATVLNSQYIAY
jgi:hypothetical protein